MKLSFSQWLGAIGTLICVIVFVRTPSFPTPDKILVFGTVVAMFFGQARELLKRFLPFVILLLTYESFRGIADKLNNNVNYMFMVDADKLLFFGRLPTALLQEVLWHGSVRWYDFVFYGAYTLHFVLPFALAVLYWKLRDREYWRYVMAFILVSYAGFLTFLLFPAAPPWLAHDKGLIEPITRVSSAVWAAFGIHDFPTVYNKISPNPVAAMPSLHAAYSMLFVLFVLRLFKSRWKYLAWIYPLLIWVGTIYQGEHYAIDAVAGIIYALLAYWAAPYVLKPIRRLWLRVWPKRKVLTDF